MRPFASSLPSEKKTGIVFVTAAVFLIFAAAFSLLCGSVRISLSDAAGAIFNGPVGMGERIFLFSRLPRTLAAIIVGAALSVSGAVIQKVLANGLASPGIIGVNSGAGLAVTLCAAFGIYGGAALSLFSFLGALLATLVISFGAWKWGNTRSTVILMMGVALNSVLGALSDSVIEFNPDIAAMSADFKIGDLSAASYGKLIPAFVAVAFCLAVLFLFSNELDVLGMGDETATGLGLNTKLFRAVFLVAAALLAGCAVSIAGLVSFVGLVVPHAVRKICGARAKTQLPLCAMIGAGFVTLCDTLARSLFSPYEIPVGIILAFVGAPLFVVILIKGKGR
ncbi:MAG: iron ABC transporter permease [Ruminococcaceae bacterium]|nr:iron ABC transporter permease [Oscillospiraceae bacterium]